MSTTPPPPQLPPPPMLNALATTGTNSVESGGDHSQSWIQNLKPSILIIILILSITVLVSVSLCFLLRHLNRRCIRHFTTTASASSTTASNRRISPELSPVFSIIDSLPLFTFSSITRRSSSNVTTAAASGSGDCAVCLSKFEGHDQLRLLPLCCHAFHAECIDTWLRSNETIANQTCPLCRSPIQVSDADVMKSLLASTTTNGEDGGGDSFRLEIGSISRRQGPTLDSIESAVSSYSMGSFDYIVEGESEITANQVQRGSISNKEDTADPEQSLVSEVGSGRSWLKDYVDRLSNSLSSRTLSFRSSGRFFTGSSRRSEAAGIIEWDMEANRVGEEISELFRWFSGV